MTSGGRKRSNSGAASIAKRSKSPGARKSNKTRARKYKNNFSQRIVMDPLRNFGHLGPDQLKTRLRYCQTNQPLVITAGVPTVRQYLLNSVFDPDVTGVGHQPFGRDQIVSLGYTKYCVTAAKYAVITECTNPSVSTANYGSSDVFAESVDQASFPGVPATCEAAIERGARFIRQYPMPSGSQTQYSDSGNYNSRNMMKRFVAMKDVLGRKIDLSDDSTPITSSPNSTDQVSLYLYAMNNQNSATTTYRVTVIIHFYVTFTRGSVATAS